MTCFVCGGNADTLDRVLLNADGDFACSKACADKYEADKKRFFASLDNDESYAAWWAEGGVDIKECGEDAWRSSRSASTTRLPEISKRASD